MKGILLVIGLAALFLFLPERALATELITNGGFESANFTGWTTVNAVNPFQPWQVSTAGAGGVYHPPAETTPPEGIRDAWQGTASNANSAFTLDQTVTIPLGATASITWRHRFQENLHDFCTTTANCGNCIYSVQILNTSNVVLQTLYTITAQPLVNTDTGWQFNLRNLNAYAGQTIKIRFMTVASVTYAGPGQLEVDTVSVQTPGIPTSATATVSGRITASDGTPIHSVSVSLADGSGNARYANSNPFGYYSFEEVPTGQTYVIGASSKQYVFPTSPIVVTVNGDLANMDFSASP